MFPLPLRPSGVSCPSIGRCAGGAECSTAAEPQPGGWSEAPQLLLLLHLATRHLPHQLPPHGDTHTHIHTQCFFRIDFWDNYCVSMCVRVCVGQVEYDGLTGHIEFNSGGQRTNYSLKILEKQPGGHREVRGHRRQGLITVCVLEDDQLGATVNRINRLHQLRQCCFTEL